ncbi:MAG TPA: glycosyltransferase [Dermatophilaceae bacterium]|nr:glycosyltransferase [Dermatophilaceae bacterium]
MSTSYGVLSTYPPTQCGLATFSSALVQSLWSPLDVVGVVDIVDSAGPPRVAEVCHEWVRGRQGGAEAAAARLNGFDVVLVQHEYGIFGGPDGMDVLDVVRAVTRPVIVVLHTVLVTPSLRQKAILDELVLLSDTVVTMTLTAKERLVHHYAVNPDKVRVVPHGAVDTRIGRQATARLGGGRTEPRATDAGPIVLTWGLLGEGKGIEWGISAMAQLRDIRPAPRYHIVGETHPKVLEREGETYRRGLEARARDLGVDDVVTFDARYLPTRELGRLVQEADVILLPYDSREQVTSGVLVEAVTAGKPVISTGFPHAVELLSSGAGLLVERQNPDAIGAALRRVFTEPGLADALAAEADRLSPALLWSAVAQQYRDLASSALDSETVRVSA